MRPTASDGVYSKRQQKGRENSPAPFLSGGLYTIFPPLSERTRVGCIGSQSSEGLSEEKSASPLFPKLKSRIFFLCGKKKTLTSETIENASISDILMCWC